MKRNENPNNGQTKPQNGGYNNGYNKKPKNEDGGPNNFEEELMMMDQYEYIEGIENTPEIQESRWSRPSSELDSKSQDLGL